MRIENQKGIDIYKTAVPRLLARISKKEYNDDIIKNGHIFMSAIKKYRAIENGGNNEIGDKYEGTLPFGTKFCIENEETHKYKLFTESNETETIAINANQCVFCFYGFDDYEINRNNIFISEYKWEEICKIMRYYNNAPCSLVIFKNPQKLITDIINEIKLKWGRGYVVYDYENCERPANTEFEPHIEVCFHKQKKYSYQQEYRIIAINNEDKDIEDLFINPLSSEDYESFDIKEFHDIKIKVTTEIISQIEQNQPGKINVLSIETTYDKR